MLCVKFGPLWKQSSSMTWPLIGVHSPDLELIVANTTEEIAVNSRFYQKIGAKGQFIPCFFWDSGQEILLYGKGEPLAFPYFTIQRQSDSNIDILAETAVSERTWLNLSRLTQQDLDSFWGSNGSCYLESELQEQLQNGEGLAFYSVQKHKKSTLAMNVYDNTASLSRDIYALYGTALEPELRAKNADSWKIDEIESQPQTAFLDSETGTYQYESSFMLHFQVVQTYLFIEPAKPTAMKSGNILKYKEKV